RYDRSRLRFPPNTNCIQFTRPQRPHSCAPHAVPAPATRTSDFMIVSSFGRYLSRAAHDHETPPVAPRARPPEPRHSAKLHAVSGCAPLNQTVKLHTVCGTKPLRRGG